MMAKSEVTSLVCVLIMVVNAPGSHASHRSKDGTGSGQTKDGIGQPAPCCLPFRFQAIVAMLPNFSDGRKVFLLALLLLTFTTIHKLLLTLMSCHSYNYAFCMQFIDAFV